MTVISLNYQPEEMIKLLQAAILLFEARAFEEADLVLALINQIHHAKTP